MLHPNPAAGRVEIGYNLPENNGTPVLITLIDAMGRMVAQPLNSVLDGAVGNRVQFSLEGIASGEYYVMMRSAGGMVMEKLAVVK